MPVLPPILSLCAARAIGGFVPTDIGGLALWLDASQIEGLADGAAISTWSDLSGNANDAAGVTTSRPTYQTGEINGLPVVRFDGVDDQLVHTTGDSASYTIFAAVKSSAAAATYLGLLSCGTGAGGTMMLLSAGTPPWGTYSNAGYPSGTTLDDGVPHILAMLDNGASGGTFRTDGADDGTWAADTAGQATIHIGGLAGQSSAVDVGEILIYSESLDGADVARVEAYLAAKWGVTLS